MLTWRVRDGHVGVSRSAGHPLVLLQCEDGFDSVRVTMTLDEAEALIDDIAFEVRRCRAMPAGLNQPIFDAAMSRILGQVRALEVQR